MPGQWDEKFVLMAAPPDGATQYLFYDAAATATELPRQKKTYGNAPQAVSVTQYLAMKVDPPRKAKITLTGTGTRVMYVYQLRSRT